MWRLTKQKWHMTKAQIKRRKGKQHGVNLLCGSGAWALGGGPSGASYDSINFIQK